MIFVDLAWSRRGGQTSARHAAPAWGGVREKEGLIVEGTSHLGYHHCKPSHLVVDEDVLAVNDPASQALAAKRGIGLYVRCRIWYAVDRSPVVLIDRKEGGVYPALLVTRIANVVWRELVGFHPLGMVVFVRVREDSGIARCFKAKLEWVGKCKHRASLLSADMQPTDRQTIEAWICRDID